MPTIVTSVPHSARRVSFATPLHALCFYVAAGITSFGWALCQLFGWDATPWMPLWFCAALMIYNADRLQRDPVDALNIPQRDAASTRLRSVGLFILATSSVVLLVLPIVRGDWLTLLLELGGTVICLNYSMPLLGFRFKDVPLLKTAFAPSIVAAALVGLPLLHGERPANLPIFIAACLRAWLFLLFNMILCDLRDLEGDRTMGIRSLPVWLGKRRTQGLLILMLIGMESIGIATILHSPGQHVPFWWLSTIVAPLYLGSLLLAVRVPRSESFYEWAVEGMLFLPALVIAAEGLA